MSEGIKSRNFISLARQSTLAISITGNIFEPLNNIIVVNDTNFKDSKLNQELIMFDKEQSE